MRKLGALVLFAMTLVTLPVLAQDRNEITLVGHIGEYRNWYDAYGIRYKVTAILNVLSPIGSNYWLTVDCSHDYLTMYGCSQSSRLTTYCQTEGIGGSGPNGGTYQGLRCTPPGVALGQCVKAVGYVNRRSTDGVYELRVTSLSADNGCTTSP